MPRRRLLLALAPMLALALVASAAPVARAHGLAPVLLEIVARADGTASVLWKTAPSLPRGAHLDPVLPERCRTVGSPTTGTTTEGVTRSWEVDCGPGGLLGESISVRDLDLARTDALLRVALPDGRRIAAVLRADRPAFVVPPPESPVQSFARGIRGGTSRVTGRVDALLFVAGLVLLARDRRGLAVAVAAFVLANGATLVAAGLGALAPRPALADLLAAASVLAIAAEVARDDADTLARRRPWIPAGLLGAIHGLTLAPEPARQQAGQATGMLALLGHHLGVEAALVAVAGGIGAAWLGRSALVERDGTAHPQADLRRAAAYPVGCAAAFLAFRGLAHLLG